MEHVGLHDEKKKHSGKKKHGGKKKHAGWKDKRSGDNDNGDEDDDENVVFKAQVQNLNEYDSDLGRSLYYQPGTGTKSNGGLLASKTPRLRSSNPKPRTSRFRRELSS